MKGNKTESLYGYLFITPQIVGLTIFSIIPIISVFYLSFCQWDAVSDPIFVGVQNYIEEIKDPNFSKAALNTLLYSLIYIPGNIIIALLLAVAIKNIKGKTAYRLCYFLPAVTGSVAMSMIWLWILEPNAGIMNYFLSISGIEKLNLLGNMATVIPTIGCIAVWYNVGYNVVIYIAGLEGIPGVYYEAAMIDGANPVTRFFKITLPMMSPTIFFTTIMTTIASFKVFDQVFVMTNGGPSKASYMYVLHIYDYGFKQFKMGQSSTAAVIFFVLLLILTIIQNIMSKRWVNYET